MVWLVPASLDVLNCLMIIYVTGSSYSSWILTLTFITAISASDPIWWRGVFTGVSGAIGLSLMLILVQIGALPFTDIWKINYRPNSWSLVVQAIALNAGVSFFVWVAIHKSSVIANTGRVMAEKENSWINLLLKTTLAKSADLYFSLSSRSKSVSLFIIISHPRKPKTNG